MKSIFCTFQLFILRIGKANPHITHKVSLQYLILLLIIFFQLKYGGKAITFARGLNFDLQEIPTHDFMSWYKYFSVYSTWANIIFF